MRGRGWEVRGGESEGRGWEVRGGGEKTCNRRDSILEMM